MCFAFRRNAEGGMSVLPAKFINLNCIILGAFYACLPSWDWSLTTDPGYYHYYPSDETRAQVLFIASVLVLAILVGIMFSSRVVLLHTFVASLLGIGNGVFVRADREPWFVGLRALTYLVVCVSVALLAKMTHVGSRGCCVLWPSRLVQATVPRRTPIAESPSQKLFERRSFGSSEKQISGHFARQSCSSR